MSPVRFAVAGDWHGNLWTARAVVRTLKNEDIHLLLHVGDLAVRWPGPKKGRFEKQLGRLLEEADIDFIFIDGNHDNHPELRELKLRSDGTRKLNERMSYLPRGSVIERYGVRIGGLGGAYSVDRIWRTEGKDLWAALEEPTAEEARCLLEAAPVDVLMTHDAPAGLSGLTGLVLSESTATAADRTRQLLQCVVEKIKPSLVFSGHWHQRLSQQMTWHDGSTTDAHVLAHEGSWGGNAVVVTWEPGQRPEVAPLIVRS